MNSGIRRFLIFVIMVGTGTVLILYNLPLLFIIALMAAIGILLIVLLSPPTAAELKSSILNIYKISFIRRQKAASKPYIKRAEQKAPETQKTVELRVEPFQVQKAEDTKQKRKFSVSPGSLSASVKSLGTILRTGKLPDRDNVEETGGIANKTGGEKTGGSALARAAELTQDPMAADKRESSRPSSSNTRIGSSPSPTDDPFLSLSSDELETGLLDTLDEEDMKRSEIRPDSTPPDLSLPYIPGSSGVTIGESDIPIPPQEISAETQEEASSIEPDLDEFNDLEGTDSIDQNLDELDTIDLDSVTPEGDMWEGEEDTSQTSPPPKPPEAATTLPEPQARKEPTPPASSPPVVSRVSLKKDDQHDMTVFTAPVSADDRIISSLVDVIKTTKKTKDMSLLRELKDFKAPAKDIEKELSDLYQGLDTISDRKGKTKPL
jgi:hypothetical protein